MPAETFKTDYSNVPKLTEYNYSMWRKKLRRVIMGADACETVTRTEAEPVDNIRDGRTEQRNWRKRRNDAQPIIYMGCSDKNLPRIKNTTEPAEMWDTLNDQFDNTLSKLGHRQIRCKLHACRPAKDDKMNTYFTRLIDYCNQLSSSAQEISENIFVTRLFTHIPKKLATTINIFE